VRRAVPSGLLGIQSGFSMPKDANLFHRGAACHPILEHRPLRGCAMLGVKLAPLQFIAQDSSSRTKSIESKAPEKGKRKTVIKI
jgi:hypothetical protein